jgi:undecaprenyl-diphosphatase
LPALGARWSLQSPPEERLSPLRRLSTLPLWLRSVLTTAFWGLVQGLTEFLPISSSGHLVLVPALLGMDEPDLATSALLHFGTLLAVVAHYRTDLARLFKARTDGEARRILLLLAVGTIPAAVFGLALDGPIEIVLEEPWIVAVALIVTGVVLLFGQLLPIGSRSLADGRTGDGVVVGLAQAFALVPGISRSGMTITAGLAQGFERVQAARYAFLLAVPSIAGAAIIEGLKLADRGAFRAELLVGMGVAAITGYVAISFLIKLLARAGLAPFGVYCIVFGTVSYILV